MGKIDRRIKYRIVLDTETAPADKEVTDVTPSNMFVYDIGWAVVDKHGNVYKKRSFVNADIFLDEAELMQSAYYADKIPQYWEEIHKGSRIVATLKTIRKTLLDDIAEYGVDEIYAHNARFDYGSLNNTERWLTKSKYRYFFPKNVTICDTLKMARTVIGKMPSYKAFCERNGFMTAHSTPRPQMSAEVIYRYISNNPAFVEKHTGLEDVMIETQIMAYCFRQHKKMDRILYPAKG